MKTQSTTSIEHRASGEKHNLSLRGEAEAILNEIPRGVYPEQEDEILRFAQNDKRQRARNDRLQVLLNEKGIALVMVLLLSAIALVIMAGLIYMLTTGTQISGIQKRYETASEAGMGGKDITYQLIGLRGDASRTASFLTDIAALTPAITTPVSCTGTNISGTAFTGLAARLNAPTSTWAGCDNSMVINPGTNTTYDMVSTLGTGPTYNVYSKIVDTVEGNSAGDEGLINNRVVDSNSGEIRVMSYPYLYTIEVDAENTANASERAKLSVLYQY